MGFETILIASAVTGAAASISAAQTAQEQGKYQQQIAEQNATMYEQKAERAIQAGEYNVRRFETNFEKQFAAVERAYAFAGVDTTSGTPLAMMESYLAEAEIEKEAIRYNAKIQKTDFRESATLSRMEGQIARYEGRSRATASYLNAGSTLLGGYGQLKYINKYGGLA